MLWLFVGPTVVHLLDFFCSGIQSYLADALAVCQAHRGVPVGFLLLWYSVLFNRVLVFALSTCNTLIYMFWELMH